MTARKTIKPSGFEIPAGELGHRHIGDVVSVMVQLKHSIDDFDRGVPALIRGELRNVGHGPEGTHVTIAGLLDMTGDNEEFWANPTLAAWVEPSS